MNRSMLEKICDPHISILQNISMLRENWLKHKDLDNAILYLHPSTYDRLLAEDTGAIYYMNFNNDKIMGIKIKVDQRVRPYHLLIREEDNMELRDYCKIDVDSLDAYRYAVSDINIGGRQNGKTLRLLNPLPTKYIINNGATILFWADGTKTIVKRSEDDIFDPVKGFLWAYFQKHSGLTKTKANKYLRDIDKENEPTITLHIDNVNLTSFIENITKED